VDSCRRGRLSTLLGQLPDGVDIPDGSAAGLLLSQVIHFLPPQAVQDTFTHAYRCGPLGAWLGVGERSVVERGFNRGVRCV
jgi:hypothetical protein